MTAIKPAQADAFIANPPAAVRAILLYGPDAGLVAERARAAAQAFTGGDAAAITRITNDDIRADAGRIADEVSSVSLFGGRRAVLVRPEGQEISRSLAALHGTISEDMLVIVAAGELKQSSPLRKLFEQESDFAAIACYGDSAGDVARLVDASLREAGVAIDADARAWLVEQLGGDRIASRMELAKLLLYARGKERISLDDAAAVIGDVSALELDQAMDALAGGDLAGFDRTLQRLFQAGTSPSQIAAAALRHFTLLDLLRIDVDAGKPARGAVQGARPPIFFKRQDAVARQLLLWPRGALETALDRLHEAERLSRQGERLAQAGVAQCLLEVCAAAARAARRAS